jgi:hypothetical protein
MSGNDKAGTFILAGFFRSSKARMLATAPLWGIWFLLMILPVFSEEPPIEVSGIMTGTTPMAIVNGTLLKTGDMIRGMRVEEIRSDSVRFRLADGAMIVHQLKKEIKKQEQTSDSRGNREIKYHENSEDGEITKEKVKENFTRAYIYLTDAERVSQQEILSVADFQKIIALYDKAERELKSNLGKVHEDQAHNDFQSVLVRVKAQRDGAIKRKQQLEDQIQYAIKKNLLVPGMTKFDVIRSWGDPITVNKGNFGNNVAEQWVYQGSREKERYLYFAEDILAGIQYLK